MPDPKNTGTISFLELAKRVLERCNPPRVMTFEEIWDQAVKQGLDKMLKGGGKTPKASLGSILYVNVKKEDSIFGKVGAGPAKFALKTQIKAIPEAKLKEQIEQIENDIASTEISKLQERDLHKLLTWFASNRLGVHCKTIYHEKSKKQKEKQNQWIHPDIVGYSLLTEDFETSVVDLAKISSGAKANLYSFEVKIALEFNTLREYFFQAVSNSSWANQGYLVANIIDINPEFRAELRRLSQSFGIGVIQLSIDEPEDSEILFPARDKEYIDWETVNRIASVNSDFDNFVVSVKNSITTNQALTMGFDEVVEGETFEKYITGLKKTFKTKSIHQK